MAASGRLYSVSFQNVTISAAQDLFNIKCSASNIIAIQSVEIGQITGTSVANQRIRFRYVPTTVTNGSGGGAGTINKLVSGDAASNSTARINDTVQATSSGTILDLWNDSWNIINGYLWVPPIPSRPIIIPPSAAFVLSLDSAPATIVTNATIVFEELP